MTLLEQKGEKVHLKKHVAQLVEQLGVITLVRRVGKLVGLLERVRNDRPLVLFAVPRALAPEPTGDLVKADESVLDPGRSRIHPRYGVVVEAGGAVAEPWLPELGGVRVGDFGAL